MTNIGHGHTGKPVAVAAHEVASPLAVAAHRWLHRSAPRLNEVAVALLLVAMTEAARAMSQLYPTRTGRCC